MTKPRSRTLVLTGTLAVAAVAVRGPLGGLLGIVALLVLVDAVVPMPGVTWSEADDRFTSWCGHAGAPGGGGACAGSRPGTSRWSTTGGRPGGAAGARVRPIAIDSITATVEEGKARAFDDEFRPDRRAAARWKGLWLAQARGAALPPISVYRVGAQHVVRDGHHRVSVARARGLTVIDADVVELVPACVSSRSPAGPSSRARGTRPPAPRSAPATATAAPSRAPAPPRRRR